MVKIKGLLVMTPPILIAFVEIYYLIWQPVSNGVSFKVTEAQYWALAIPIVIGTILISLMMFWVGYTMIVTPEPIRLTYEEAYEAAIEIPENDDKNN